MKIQLRHDVLTGLMLAALLFFNLFDSVTTAIYVSRGDAREINPLMDVLIQFSPTVFLLLKNSYGVVVAVITWTNRTRPAVVPVASAVTLAYAVNFGYQLGWIVLVWGW